MHVGLGQDATVGNDGFRCEERNRWKVTVGDWWWRHVDDDRVMERKNMRKKERKDEPETLVALEILSDCDIDACRLPYRKC
jgi:hypothetical protein